MASPSSWSEAIGSSPLLLFQAMLLAPSPVSLVTKSRETRHPERREGSRPQRQKKPLLQVLLRSLV